MGERTRRERVWRTRITNAQTSTNVLAAGPNANFLETMYLKVNLPKDYIFRPMMGVRVRESAKKLPFFGDDPILGIQSINLLTKLMAECYNPLLQSQ